MGWYGGEWVSGPCEDAPCCGCCGPMGDDRPDERAWSWEDDDHFGRGSWDDDEESDEDEDNDYWQAEDSALESSLFGDC